MVLCAEMEADNRRSTHRKTEKHRHKNHTDVHQHAISRHAVLSGITEKLGVIQHRHQRHRDIAHQLRGAVGADTKQIPPRKNGFGKAQAAGVFTKKVNHRQKSADTFAEHSRHCRADDPPPENGDKQRVQRHIGDPCRHSDPQPQFRFFRRDQQRLKFILQEQRRNPDDDHAGIKNTVFQQFPLRPKQSDHRAEDRKTDTGNCDPAKGGK